MSQSSAASSGSGISRRHAYVASDSSKNEKPELNLPQQKDITINDRDDFKKAIGNKRTILTAFEIQNFQMAVKYVVSDTAKHKKAFVIGFFTVFLVVFFISLLQNAIAKAPIIFIKLSEDQVGEYDLLMIPSFSSDISSFVINSTQVIQDLKSEPLVSGAVPRWTLLGKIGNPETRQNSTVTLLIIDSKAEADINLGRAWHYPALGENETYVSSSVLRGVNVQPGTSQQSFLRFDFRQLFALSGGGASGSSASVGQQVAQSGDIDQLLLQFFLSDPNIAPFANVSLEVIIPQIQISLGPFGINVTSIVENFLGPNITGFTVQDLLLNVVDSIVNSLVVERNYTVKAGIDAPLGKFPSALGNVAILESKYIQVIIKQLIANVRNQGLLPTADQIAILEAAIPFLPPQTQTIVQNIVNVSQTLNTTLTNFENGFQVNDYALSVVCLYRDRFKTYVKDQKALDLDMITFTNRVSESIGYTFPASFVLPLKTALQPLYFIRLFLDQIFTFVVVVLIFLGGMLIYSLLLSNVEEKTYEYGMLRALGMKQYVLIELLLLQSISFSIPGILVGLLVSFLVYIPIGNVIGNYSLSPVDITMDGKAVAIAVILGFVMPLIAIGSPISRALSRTLRDALDIYHQVQSETTVRIIKLEKMGLSPWQISASVLMIVMGFVVYYLIPYAFTFQDLPLFFSILIFILLGMLFGLSLVGTTFQPYLERGVIYVLLWGPEYKTLNNLVKKNLGAHSRRNIKTAIMFTTALAFIIFAGTSFSLQGHTIGESVKLASGSDQVVFANSVLDKDGMKSFLDTEMARSDSLVLGYTFVTPALCEYEYCTRTRISNLAAFPSTAIDIYGVEQNYLDATFDEFYQYTELASGLTFPTTNNKPDAIKSLYSNKGKRVLPIEENGIIVPPDITTGLKNDSSSRVYISLQESYTNYVDVVFSEALRYGLSVDTNSPIRLTVNFAQDSVNTSTIQYLSKTHAMIRALPGFLFSSYRQTASGSSVLVTMDTYYKLMKDMYDGGVRNRAFETSVPQQTLHVKLRSGLTQIERDIVLNGLRNYVTDDLTQILDTNQIVDSTKVAIDLLTLFFNIVSVIAVVLCFFVLWLSFTANINENSWEFGVLRALGLTGFKVIRMYIYEALCLIISAVLIGSIIGVAVAVTLTLQFNLFTELAFTFDFPYVLFFSVLGMSVFVAVFGSFLPSESLRKKQIAIALKNL